MHNAVIFTDHALERCAQRNLTEDDILLAVRYGEREFTAGGRVFFLGKRHIMRAGLPPCYDRLEGLTVHASKEKDGRLCIITVYRDRKNGLKKNRRKSKYDLRHSKAA
ncbi:MAG: hypothetical protein Kow00106_07810 [Anaerolineae bacterium]